MTAGQAVDRIRLPGPFGFYLEPNEQNAFTSRAGAGGTWIVNADAISSLDLLCRIKARYPAAEIELWFEDARRQRKARCGKFSPAGVDERGTGALK